MRYTELDPEVVREKYANVPNDPKLHALLQEVRHIDEYYIVKSVEKRKEPFWRVLWGTKRKKSALYQMYRITSDNQVTIVTMFNGERWSEWCTFEEVYNYLRGLMAGVNAAIVKGKVAFQAIYPNGRRKETLAYRNKMKNISRRDDYGKINTEGCQI